MAAVALCSLSVGFTIGQRYRSPHDIHHGDEQRAVLPNGLPRTCCDYHRQTENTTAAALTSAQKELPTRLSKIVGPNNVLDGSVQTTQTMPFLKGARLGSGTALCIVTPRTLHDVVQIAQAIVDADCVILPQGQNTGLTGGSVPHTTKTTTATSHNHRPTVVLSLKHINRIFPIDDGQRVVCLAGVGLAQLQEWLHKYFPDRESHSVLGSTFLNPTTAAGVAFGSGGTQCRKGPAYTERALAIQVTTNKWQERNVQVINTLGIQGMDVKKDLPKGGRKVMDSPAYIVDTWSRWVQEGYVRDMRYSTPEAIQTAQASDTSYAERLCRQDSSVSRYNADTKGPDWNRSEGKVIILATVHDTFPKPKETKTFWISFDSLETALQFRRQVCLENAKDLPVSCEYMDRDAFDVVDRSGRMMGNVIKLVGASSPIVRNFWNVKLWVEALPFVAAPLVVDKFLHTINPFVPSVLPKQVQDMGKKMDHHVAMTVGEFDDGSMDRLLDRLQKFASKNGRDKILIHECQSKSEVASLTAFRFVAAPAFRTWCVGEGAQGYSVDYALPKDKGSAPPISPDDAKPIKRMRYSHFACNVVHEDLAYELGVDVDEAKHALKKTVESKCRGKLPAEHGHGTEYVAPPDTQRRWKRMDPLNVLNPGVGGTSENFRYMDK